MDISHLKNGPRLVNGTSSGLNVQSAVSHSPENLHKNTSSETPESRGMTVMSYQFESLTAAEFDEAQKQRFKVSYEISNPMESLVKPYQQVMNQLSKTNPTIAYKDWELGINKSNEVVIHSGNNPLSSENINVLTHAFDKPVFKKLFKAFSDAVISASTGDFRYDKVPGSVAHYNLNQDNISDVIRLREFIVQESKHQFNSFTSLRDQLLERGADFLKPEAADMKLVDVFA